MHRAAPIELPRATALRVDEYRRRYGWAGDDIDQAAELGRLEAEATGADLDATVRRAVRQAVDDLKGRLRVARGYRVETVAVDRWRARHRPARPALRPDQRRRLARDALIVLGRRHGFSLRTLASLFGLDRSRIVEILHTLRHRTEPAPEPES